jgi:hypothetical protein
MGKFTQKWFDRKWVKMVWWVDGAVGGLFFGGEEDVVCLVVDADDVGAEEIHA